MLVDDGEFPIASHLQVPLSRDHCSCHMLVDDGEFPIASHRQVPLSRDHDQHDKNERERCSFCLPTDKVITARRATVTARAVRTDLFTSGSSTLSSIRVLDEYRKYAGLTTGWSKISQYLLTVVPRSSL